MRPHESHFYVTLCAVIEQSRPENIAMHTATLRAVGGSVSVTLPRQMLRTLGLAAGASVAVTLEDGRLVLSPARPRYSLTDLLAGMKPGDMPTAPGWEDARPVGREAW
jgi:antitoxin ChpS